jgi:hypothetical protein
MLNRKTFLIGSMAMLVSQVALSDARVSVAQLAPGTPTMPMAHQCRSHSKAKLVDSTA